MQGVVQFSQNTLLVLRIVLDKSSRIWTIFNYTLNLDCSDTP